MKKVMLSVLFSFISISDSLLRPFDSDGAYDAVFNRAAESYRLSGDAIPISYDIFLYPQIHLNNFEFMGTVQITFRAEKAMDQVILHARRLKIHQIDLIDLTSNRSYMGYVVNQSRTTDFLTVASSHVNPFDIKKGQLYQLNIGYRGTLRTDNAGFYQSTYLNAKNQSVILATTQFQPTDARHAFPCFDEPVYKATFDIKIRHGSNYNAISNMPAVGVPSDNGDGTKTTQFQKTPIMSTYLVSFIISDFVSTESALDNKPHRVFSRAEAKPFQNFALQTSKLALKNLEDYLGISYNLPKIDNVAIPDFAAGAMENWGLVTYREEYLLFNQQKSTINTQLNIAIMIAHEFVHQWFGDLVTPSWWMYLWLNEGFASLYEFIIVDNIYPDWNVMQVFTISHFQRALLSDAGKNPRAMSTYVEDPISIANIFDTVSYGKAACVLRMFQHTLTDAAFRDALNKYLTAKSFDVVAENDLFAYLGAAATNQNIFGSTNSARSFFASWTNQGGYPILTVTRDYSTGGFEIKQEIFDGTNAPTTVQMWVVPFNYVYGNNPNFTSTRADGFMLKVPKVMVVRGGSKHSSSDWLLLNKQQTGYYRVNYDRENWRLLIKALKTNHNVIHPHNRAQLIDDALRLTLAGRLSADVPLSLIEYIKNEEDYAPWAAANSAFAAIDTYLLAGQNYDLYQYYISQLVLPNYGKLGMTESANDTMLRKLTRNLVINWACKANVENCLDETNKRLNEVIDNNKEVEPNLRNSIFCNGLIKGGEKEFSYIFRRMMSSDDQAERRQLMPTLGCSQNESLLMEFVQTSIIYSVEINYREQERLNVFNAIVDKNQVGLRVAMRFLMENHIEYSQLDRDFTKANTLLSALRRISSRIFSKDLLEGFITLINNITNTTNSITDDLISVRATAEKNVKWIEENMDEYNGWLQKYKNSGHRAIISTAAIVMTVMTVMLLCSL